MASETSINAANNQQTFTLKNDQTGDEYKLPVIDGIEGPSVIDVRKLYAETGMFTFANCKMFW